MRLATRAHQLISVGGAARGGRRVALTAASAAADVVLARRLARSDRPDLLAHWLVDAADLVAWRAASTRPGVEQLSAALTPGHPLAIEAGARHAARGLAVPVANAVVATAVDRLRHRPVAAEAFAWQVAAAVGGAGLARYARRLRARRLRGRAALLASDLQRAELAAQNAAALGVGNVIDEVQRAAVLLHLADRGASAAPAASAGPWKAELAARTRRSHRYLVDALLAWQRVHNDTPRLADVVDLVVDPDLAPVVMTDAAATDLAAQLDALGLRGRVAVRRLAVDAEHLRLAVGDRRIDVDTGVRPADLEFDPVPGGFAWMALWLAVSGPQCGVPARAALPPSAAALGLMAWAHRTSRSGAPPSRDVLLVASTALTVAASVAQTRAMRAPHDALGIPPMPVGLALRGHAFVTALARRRASPAAVAVAVGGGAVAAAASWARTPPPRPRRELAAELTWVVMASTMARAFTDGIDRDSAELAATLEGAEARQRAAAAEAGRRAVLDAAGRELAAAEAMWASAAPTLPPDVRTEARRRLDRCAELLAAARADPLHRAPAGAAP